MSGHTRSRLPQTQAASKGIEAVVAAGRAAGERSLGREAASARAGTTSTRRAGLQHRCASDLDGVICAQLVLRQGARLRTAAPPLHLRGEKRLANREHLKTLRRGAAAWNRWRAAHPDVTPDLSGADLHRIPLEGFDLSDAKLASVDAGGVISG